MNIKLHEGGLRHEFEGLRHEFGGCFVGEVKACFVYRKLCTVLTTFGKGT